MRRRSPVFRRRIASPLVALATALAGGCAVTGEEAEGEVIELEPAEDDKEDGSRSRTFLLTRERPQATLEVACDEWFSCDLELWLTAVDPPPDHVYWLDVRIRQESSGRECAYELATGLVDGVLRADWWDIDAAACEETADESIHVWSSDPDERFTITVRDDWADDQPVTMRARAAWY